MRIIAAIFVLPAISSYNLMRQLYQILFFFLLTSSGCAQKNNFIEKVDNKYEVVDEKKQLVGQIVKQLRQKDSLPVTILTKVFNYEDDTRLKYLTGFSKKDGLQPYLVDSIFYDLNGNDTMTKSFARLNNAWQPIQLFYKRFRSDNKVDYFMTERSFKKDYYFKKEIFYLYNDNGKLLSETEAECRQRNNCDSTFKKQYIYSENGKVDSIISFSWKNNSWVELRRRNGR